MPPHYFLKFGQFFACRACIEDPADHHSNKSHLVDNNRKIICRMWHVMCIHILFV